MVQKSKNEILEYKREKGKGRGKKKKKTCNSYHRQRLIFLYKELLKTKKKTNNPKEKL